MRKQPLSAVVAATLDWWSMKAPSLSAVVLLLFLVNSPAQTPEDASPKDEFSYLVKYATAMHATGIVSVWNLSSSQLAEEGFDFRSNTARLGEYLKECNGAPVFVHGAIMANQPLSTLSVLDADTLLTLQRLREESEGVGRPARRVHIVLHDVPLPVVLSELSHLLNVRIVTGIQAHSPISVQSCHELGASELVGVLAALCKVCGWQLRVGASGEIQVTRRAGLWVRVIRGVPDVTIDGRHTASPPQTVPLFQWRECPVPSGVAIEHRRAGEV